MFRYLSLLLIILAFTSSALALQNLEDVKIVPKERPTVRSQPKGPTRARTRTRGVLNGVLFVLTDPPGATVLVKNRQGAVVKKSLSDQEGEFRVEVPPDTYSIEVASDNYSPETKKGITIKSAQPAIERIALTPTVGSIIIGPAEPGMNILIDRKKPAKVNVMAEKNQIEINDIPVGSHTLSITHPDIVDWQTEIKVEGGSTTYLTIKFQPALVNLVVKSEPGATVYVDESPKGRVTENGEVRIPDIKLGQHTIRAEKDGYESEKRTLTLKASDALAGDKLVEMKLSLRDFSPEFADYFIGGAGSWEAPSSWQVKPGKMVVNGDGTGFVRGMTYKDFKMVFDISFANNKGAVWIVRARDSRNYYMFQLSGPKAANPKTFKSYICQNGQIKLIKPPELVVEDLSRRDDSFTITIEAKGPVIRHFIQVKSAPSPDGPQPLSTVSDGNFSYGKVGFGTKDDEEYIVHFINVVPDKQS
ncbi:MAG: carboxypeptidase regulatory-like domain-containing protein [Blastocatellia bacterium]|nr:carboxypeptidase regulatory-like domain-containing protein [Blastocatellia bacterium]